jgi:sec-independent protein translocase protein TatA
MPNIGPLEVAIVLIIALVIFGPKRIPELGHSLGKGIREFRGSIGGEKEDEEKSKAPPLGETPAKAEAEPAVDAEVVGETRK